MEYTLPLETKYYSSFSLPFPLSLFAIFVDLLGVRDAAM